MKNQGGCHCGKVRFETNVDISKGITCNCSICSKRGTILNFCPEDQFKQLSGQDSLSEYNFNKKVIHHLFCKSCGVTSFARGQDPQGNKMIAVNLRCIDDIDLDSIKIDKVDGKSF